VHYAPTNGCWLNQAEIEIGMFFSPVPRYPETPGSVTVQLETRVWNRRISRARTGTN
jgi:hypothetical protein